MCAPRTPISKGKTLKVIRRGDNEQLLFTWTTYEGHPYVSVSLWRKDDNEVLRPVGEKTMSLRISELPDVADAIAEAIELAKVEVAQRNSEQ